MDLEQRRSKAKWAYRFYLAFRILHFCGNVRFVFYTGEWLGENGELGFFTANCAISLALLFSLVIIAVRNIEIDMARMELIIFVATFIMYTLITLSKLTNTDNLSSNDQDMVNTSSLSDVLINLVDKNNRSSKYPFTSYDIIDGNVNLTNVTFSPFKNSSDFVGHFDSDQNDDILSISNVERMFKRISNEIYLYYVLPSFVSMFFQFVMFYLASRYKEAAKALSEAEQQNMENVEMIPVQNENQDG